MCRLRSVAVALVASLAVASPTFASDPPNGVDDDPTTIGAGRPSDAEFRNAVHFVYDNMAAGSSARVRIGKIRAFGRIWRRATVSIDGPRLHLRFDVKVTERVEGYDFFAKPLSG